MFGPSQILPKNILTFLENFLEEFTLMSLVNIFTEFLRNNSFKDILEVLNETDSFSKPIQPNLCQRQPSLGRDCPSSIIFK